MTPHVHQPTPAIVGNEAQLIPPERAVHVRLTAVCREARLLRKLLKLCREAASADADPVPSAAVKGVGRG